MDGQVYSYIFLQLCVLHNIMIQKHVPQYFRVDLSIIVINYLKTIMKP